jgi:hypothetical protein
VTLTIPMIFAGSTIAPYSARISRPSGVSSTK